MAAAQVTGKHQAVTVAAMQGHLQLNAFKPMIGANVLRSIDRLNLGMESFTLRCVRGLDRGELDKILKRSATETSQALPPPQAPPQPAPQFQQTPIQQPWGAQPPFGSSLSRTS
jgi:Zn-finger nucleic acid-binding protein